MDYSPCDEVLTYLWLLFPACTCQRPWQSCQSSPQPAGMAPWITVPVMKCWPTCGSCSQHAPVKDPDRAVRAAHSQLVWHHGLQSLWWSVDLPVALVPSMHLSKTLTELSEQPTASWYGTMDYSPCDEVLTYLWLLFPACTCQRPWQSCVDLPVALVPSMPCQRPWQSCQSSPQPAIWHHGLQSLWWSVDLPVALVPSMHLSKTLTELSEQPTASWYGTMDYSPCDEVLTYLWLLFQQHDTRAAHSQLVWHHGLQSLWWSVDLPVALVPSMLSKTLTELSEQPTASWYGTMDYSPCDEVLTYLWLLFPACTCQRPWQSCQSSPQPAGMAPWITVPVMKCWPTCGSCSQHAPVKDPDRAVRAAHSQLVWHHGLQSLWWSVDLPVALVPSMHLSKTLTELSEQPTASWYGTMGLIARDVTALWQLMSTSWNTEYR